MNTTQQRIILAGYLEEEWEKWREAMPDGDSFDWSFLEWSEAITETVCEQRAKGHDVAIQIISLDGFLLYASENQLSLSTQSRSLYAISLC